MSVSTISGSVGNFVTLGSGNYAGQLTITSAGIVGDNSFTGDTSTAYFQVTVDQAASTLLNQGSILGGYDVVAPGTMLGVSGLELTAGYVRNDHVIRGGAGPGNSYGVLQSGGTLANYGGIYGGQVGRTGFAGTFENYGVVLTQGSLLNAGQIWGGAGAAGLRLSGGTVDNSGTITGGFYSDVPSNVYGPGVTMSGGSLLNTGRILAAGGTGAAVEMSGGSILRPEKSTEIMAVQILASQRRSHF